MARILFFLVIIVTTSFINKESDLSFDKDFILEKVNSLRSQGCYCGGKYMPPTAPLKWDNDLYKSAFSHAKDMEANDYFSHFNRRGQDIGERLEIHGYSWQVAGENLGEGQRNFIEVMDDWLDSYSHCRMLMNHKVVDMAVARYGRYWVQHFGKRLPQGAKPKTR